MIALFTSSFDDIVKPLTKIREKLSTFVTNEESRYLALIAQASDIQVDVRKAKKVLNNLQDIVGESND